MNETLSDKISRTDTIESQRQGVLNGLFLFSMSTLIAGLGSALPNLIEPSLFILITSFFSVLALSILMYVYSERIGSTWIAMAMYASLGFTISCASVSHSPIISTVFMTLSVSFLIVWVLVAWLSRVCRREILIPIVYSLIAANAILCATSLVLWKHQSLPILLVTITCLTIPSASLAYCAVYREDGYSSPFIQAHFIWFELVWVISKILP